MKKQILSTWTKLMITSELRFFLIIKEKVQELRHSVVTGSLTKSIEKRRVHKLLINLSTYLHIILLFLLSTPVAYSQISPGDLAQSHADLEGMSNCTLCHDLGKKVSNAKCLDCHKEIKSLIDKKQGYHASSDIKRKDCFECHSDHHGRKFDMVRFDEDNFDHDLAGYKLEGEHGKIDCRECHVPDNIRDREIRKREDTFLGLEEKCLSCHDDYHQTTLSDDCAKCHNIEEFKPAPKFDHDDTKYKLTGEHVEVDCVKCHKKETKNGKEFQVFTDLLFDDCISCHEDPHDNKIEGKCSQCHTEKSFATLIGKRRFKHNRRTDFTLKGKHKSVDCYSCHKKEHDPLRVFQDRKGVSENQCAVCHEDEHEGKFGDDCAKCHTEKSFTDLKAMDFFDHNVTDYPLEGNHTGIDCKECHTASFLEPIDFSACKNCHEDYHKSEFETNGITPDCNDCHSLEEGFEYSLFTIERHQESAFPLDGAHLATPCFACHISEEDERWAFRNIGSECVDCHEDIHKEFISDKYYPKEDCNACHISDSWASVDFDHSLTEWPLEGKHAEVSCRECHFEASAGDDTFTQIFKGLDNECINCHENIHEDQFAILGITDCKRCHNSDSWSPENFDHNTTAFRLEGAHAEIECSACHKASIKNGKNFTDYKIEKFECIDCHQ